ncbi:hypothetical protein BOX15_Mlig025818g1 [Macrostomum lignano]|uniref:TIR domain-containing protein n=3 Tax=Macrostomum lignano TaxID=282301 RepID=A0A267GNU3_9PLAT|nr:hypothetical protein BOX15_Mlig025818g1 [Macrostomum lignano]
MMRGGHSALSGTPISLKYFSGDGPCVLQSELLLVQPVSMKTLAQLRNVLLAKAKHFRPEHRFRSLSGELVPIDMESCLAFNCVLRSTNSVFVIGDGENIACDSLEVGIVLTSPINGDELPVGFVDISPRESLEQLRKRAAVFLPLLAGCEFLFLNRRGWPVSELYEARLRVHEVLDHRRSVSVAPLSRMQADVRLLAGASAAAHAIPACPATAAAASPSLAPALLPSARQPPQTPLPPAAPYRPHSSLAVASSNLAGTAAGGKRHLEQLLGDADLLQGRHSGRSAAKDMLISYVRAEAAHVAVVLKEKLTALGCSVFLDVDEIALGSDWQDALNDAVAATEVFIPLVTPRYGATQWTNREVKLADVLGKEILPISFISDWPPRCLAIQFATTQFVPWSGAYDIESANINDEAGRVAEEIRRQFDANKRRPPESESDERGSAMGPPSFKRKPTCLSIMSRKSIKFRQSKEIDQFNEQQQNLQQQQQQQRKQSLHQLHQQQTLRTVQSSLDEDEGVYRALMSNRQVVVSYHADDFAKADQLRSALVNRNFKVSVFAISCSVRCSTEVGGGSQEAAAAGTSDAAVAAAPAAASGAGGGDSAGSQGSSIGMRRIGSRETLILGDELDTCSHSSVEQAGDESRESLLDFQTKADSAGAAVFIVSDSFLASRSSRNHIFYCEQRKHMIPVLCGNVQLPTWLTMLLEGSNSVSSEQPGWPEKVAGHLETIFDPNTMAYMHKSKALDFRIDKLAQMVKSHLPANKWFIYVCRSKRLANRCSDSVCKALGEALAQLDWVGLVTGGGPGADQIVSRQFSDSRRQNGQSEDTWHLLHDSGGDKSSSTSAAAAPKSPNTPPQFGKSLVCGDSAAERLQIAAHLCSLCLLIEGGTKSVEEADQFMWHDKVVLPLKCLGGAAASYYGESERRFEVPPGVSQKLWSKLAVPLDCGNYTAEHLVANVLKIIHSLRGYEKRAAAQQRPGFLCRLRGTT